MFSQHEINALTKKSVKIPAGNTVRRENTNRLMITAFEYEPVMTVIDLMISTELTRFTVRKWLINNKCIKSGRGKVKKWEMAKRS